MKRIIRYIFVALTLAAMIAPFGAAANKKTRVPKGKQAAEVKKPEKKDSYEKFVRARGTKKYPGIVNLYMDKSGKVWAEIPDSLLGRDFLFDQITKADGDLTATDGRCIAKNLIYRIERRDSAILFTMSHSTAYAGDAEDSGIAEAISQSTSRATVFKIPVKCAKKDSSSYVFEITNVLSPSKANTRLSGLSIGSMTVSDGSFNSKKSGKPSPVCFNNSFGIRREASFDCTGSVILFESKGVFNSTIQTTLTLLPSASDFPLKKADSRIGTYNVTRTTFSPTGKNSNDKVISRWDLSGGKVIKVYIDTLFSPVMFQAVREGIVAWNRAFVAAGLGARIMALPFDKSVNVDDPLVSSVKFCGGIGSGISGIVHRHENGRILSFQICIPRYLSDFVRRDATMFLGDVDKRYTFRREQNEEAVAEIARARVMKLAANCLGMENNMAGSRAYTPAQLRDPEFTRLHGISSSVTDDALFNYFAQSGDKQRGLSLLNDRLGEYDLYAIAWIYADGEIDDLPEHLYVGATRSGWSDPRGIRRDLSSDVVAGYDAARKHLQNCIPAMKEWKMTECPNESEGDDLLIDWIFLNNFYTMASLSNQVGGVGTNEMRQEGGRPKFEAIPADIQRKCTEKMLNLVDEMSYIQDDKQFLLMFGPNKNVTDYIQLNVQGMLMLADRLPKILAACELGGSGFSATEFMDMIQTSMFRNVLRGRLEANEEMKIAQYLTILSGMNEVTAVNLKETRSGHRMLAPEVEEFRANMSAVQSRFTAEAELMAYNYLQKSADLLKLARFNFSDENRRARLEYLIYLADSALGKEKK